jgi:hypothetical protein
MIKKIVFEKLPSNVIHIDYASKEVLINDIVVGFYKSSNELYILTDGRITDAKFCWCTISGRLSSSKFDDVTAAVKNFDGEVYVCKTARELATLVKQKCKAA